MKISRQHAETELTELVGAEVTQLLAVPSVDSDHLVGVMYLLADGTWYCFFLDAGLLFLDECPGPDPEDDLETGQLYIDLASMLGHPTGHIEEFTMRESALTMRFSTGASLILKEEDGRTKFCLNSP